MSLFVRLIVMPEGGDIAYLVFSADGTYILGISLLRTGGIGIGRDPGMAEHFAALFRRNLAYGETREVVGFEYRPTWYSF